VEDLISLTLRYDNGAIGSLLAASCAPGGESTGDRIYGTEGQIVFGRGGMRVYTTRDVEGLTRDAWTELSFPDVDVRQVFIERFAEAVLEGRAPDISGEQGRKTLEVIYAAYRSGELHQPVTLPMD
jgi:predicted dehydrogenase